MEELPRLALLRIISYLNEFSQLCLSHVSHFFLSLAEEMEREEEEMDKAYRLRQMELSGIIPQRLPSFRATLRLLIKWEEDDEDDDDDEDGGDREGDEEDVFEDRDFLPPGIRGRAKYLCLSVMNDTLNFKYTLTAPSEKEAMLQIVDREVSLDEMACDAAYSLICGRPLAAILSLRYFHRQIESAVGKMRPKTLGALHNYVRDEVYHVLEMIKDRHFIPSLWAMLRTSLDDLINDLNRPDEDWYRCVSYDGPSFASLYKEIRGRMNFECQMIV